MSGTGLQQNEGYTVQTYTYDNKNGWVPNAAPLFFAESEAEHDDGQTSMGGFLSADGKSMGVIRDDELVAVYKYNKKGKQGLWEQESILLQGGNETDLPPGSLVYGGAGGFSRAGDTMVISWEIDATIPEADDKPEAYFRAYEKSGKEWKQLGEDTYLAEGTDVVTVNTRRILVGRNVFDYNKTANAWDRTALDVNEAPLFYWNGGMSRDGKVVAVSPWFRPVASPLEVFKLEGDVWCLYSNVSIGSNDSVWWIANPSNNGRIAYASNYTRIVELEKVCV